MNIGKVLYLRHFIEGLLRRRLRSTKSSFAESSAKATDSEESYGEGSPPPPEATEDNAGCSAARLAHLVWDQRVAGSNPATPTLA